jgi:hypothetical protein
MEIKKVLQRNEDKLKYVVVPKNSDIEAGDYVRITKVVEVENATTN